MKKLEKRRPVAIILPKKSIKANQQLQNLSNKNLTPHSYEDNDNKTILTSEQKENFLQNLYIEYTRLIEMKTDLITFLSHEFKTPLIPIIGWVELIKTQLEHGKKISDIIGYEEILSIFKSATRLNYLIDFFLELYQGDTTCVIKNRHVVDISLLLYNSLEKVEHYADSHHILIHVNVGHVPVQVDSVKIEKIFTDILTNCIKISPEGSEIRINSIIKLQHYELSIIDQGLELSPDEIESAWRPFSASLFKMEKMNLVPRTGVEFYLAKQIIEQHQGSIDIRSNIPNSGSTITLILPIYSPYRLKGKNDKINHESR
ncbi:MAG TPA: HAMP domain-containing sensor histidine kinase [Candidatus Lokiarchaeia archaeon]|nr:HAMP domain-containing sensor histidine kinase [Candidatus Lokiarchaeia archaeon]